MYDKVAKKATLKYMKEKRENLNLNFPKGKKAIFKAYAQFRGMSLTELITQLIEDDMEKYHFIPEEEMKEVEQ
ncbi:MAG: antitoxin [Oscillospiraceae bacterium]|nr:antitoxin [Oscillospiraceae bacterium]